MDHVEYVYTAGIDGPEIDRRLRERGHGVLALARADDAYGIPINYCYDGDQLFVRFGESTDSEKLEYANQTGTATLVVYDASDEPNSWSVIVRGQLRRLDEEERAAFTETDLNEAFPPFRLFDEVVESVDIAIFELVPDAVTGRMTVES